MPPHPPWCQLPPPASGQRRCRHVSHGPSSRVLAWDISGPATRLVAPAPASWHRAAPEPPCVPWLQLPPSDSWQLRSRHGSHGSSSRLLSQGSSGAATCPMELYGLWTIEVNKYPTWHCHRDLPLGVRVSSKTPHDKADTVRMRDMRLAAH
jgi:hypothetical protein